MKYEEFLRKYFIKGSLVLLFILLANILVLAFGVMKLEKKADDLSQKAEKGRLENEKLEKRVREKESEVKKIGEGRLVMQTLNEQIFQKRSERGVDFQKAIKRLVEEAGMSADKFDYKYDTVPKDLSREPWKNGYVEVSLNLQPEGSYPQVKKFVSLIENSGHFMTIDGLAISKTNQGGALVDLKIALTTYFIYDGNEDSGGSEK